MIIALVAIHASIRASCGLWIWAELLIITGALSNFFDRFWYGGVIDFIHVHCGSWSFPVFNGADISIVCGVALLLWEFIHE
jgi:signal peptidase II